jgi:hypothetical protein
LPAPVARLDTTVVDAAMRVLGQGWSLAMAPAGTLPPGVKRTSKSVVTQKALMLAEAGLRIELGEAPVDAIRDLVFDFYGGSPVDPAFDQLLRETSAGRELAAALGVYLAPRGAIAFVDALAPVAASGPDFLSFAVEGTGGAPLVLRDAAGKSLTLHAETDVAEVAGGVWLPFGTSAVGFVMSPGSSSYTLEMPSAGTVRFSAPHGGGSVNQWTADLPGPGRLVWNAAEPDVLTRYEGEVATPLAAGATIAPSGPQLLGAAIVGPRILDGAMPLGLQIALLFDRVVDAASAGDRSHYEIPENGLRVVKRQLSGRLAFGTLEQPEGKHVPTRVKVREIADGRGVVVRDQETALTSLLEDPGAVVSGRVLDADGSPIAGARVFYSNSLTDCDLDAAADAANRPPEAVAMAVTGPDGRYEFRYVRRNVCTFPWRISTVDPSTGSLREVSGYVQYDGEHIPADIVMFGRGSVTGIVTRSGVPVPGARVHVLSQTDPQIARLATTDGD